MQRKVSKAIVEELLAIADIADDSENSELAEALRFGACLASQGQAAIDAAHPDILKEIAGELHDWSTKDQWAYDTRARRELIEALAAFGGLTKHDPSAVYLGRKPRTVTIEGVQYDNYN